MERTVDGGDAVTAIWLLSTRRRPELAQEAIDACMDAGMTSPGVVYVDEDNGSYDKLRLPKNWSIHREPEWLSLQGSMQWCFNKYPDATQYGWLADDTHPRTHGWDKMLEAEADGWRLSYANDLWFSDNPGEVEQLEKGNNLSSGLCWGGDLVRAVGWWALPGVIQAGIDMAWLDIVRPFGLHRYRPDIVVEHLNWRTKKRPYDETDQWERPGVGNYIDRDLDVKNQWHWSRAYRNLMQHLEAAAPADANLGGALQARRQSLVDELWVKGGLPAARLQRIQEGGYDNIFVYEKVLDPDADEGSPGLAAAVHPVGS